MVVVATIIAPGLYLLRAHKVPIGIGVEIRARGGVPDWMCNFTRDGLSAVLSEVGNLQVSSMEKIDLVRKTRGIGQLEAAGQLSITKFVSGRLSLADHHLTLEVDVVDMQSGRLEDSQRLEGDESQLVDMQNEAALRVLAALHVEVSRAELKSIVVSRTNDQLGSYRLLTESMGAPDVEEPPEIFPKPEAPSGRWELPWPQSAHADEQGADVSACKRLLERFQTALEAKDVAQVAALYVKNKMSDEQRGAMSRYFQRAEQMRVKFSKTDILIMGDEGVVSFTRSDDFTDADGRDMHLEVRVSFTVARQGNEWRIQGKKKSS